MSWSRLTVGWLSGVAAAALVVAGVTSPAWAGGQDFVPNQALVRLQAGVAVGPFAQQYGATVIASIPGRNVHQLGLGVLVDEQAFVEAIGQDARVGWSDLNFFGEDVDPNGTTQTFFFARSLQQYQADPTPGLIGAPDAQTVSRGAGVVVAVVDSGIDAAHPVLAGRIRAGGFDFVEGDANPADTGPGPQRGHGTLASGLVTRIAPDAQVLPVRVLDSFGDTTVFRVAQGLYWAMDQGATVINVSLGTLADPALLRDAMNEAEARGVVIVAAAGNDSTSSPPRSPASLRSLGALSVASTDALGVRSDFSNYGTWIAISAPGQGAIGPVPGGGYGSADGTSFASPLVAGVVALLRAECPLLSPQALRDQIAQTAQSINAQNPSYLGQLGAGWVRADAALGVGQGPLDCRCDRDNNGRVNVEDLYLQIAQPGDLNGDGVADELDAIDLEALLRRHELRR